MYTVIKRMEISAAHSLKLSYRSKCEDLHGHIKETVKGKLDHRNLNEVLPFNPTAENIARWICEQIPTCFKVEVQESESNVATYEKE